MNTHIKTNILIAGTILLLAAKSVLGAENATNEQALASSRGDYYRAKELSLDAFGTAALGENTINHLSNSRVRHDSRFGVGVGANYFITRYIGIGADVYTENFHRNFVDSAEANLILRLPLGQSGFAPYAFGGFGRQIDLSEVWFGQFGAGLEYRFTPHIGVFLDARCVVADRTPDYGVARLGVRFAF